MRRPSTVLVAALLAIALNGCDGANPAVRAATARGPFVDSLPGSSALVWAVGDATSNEGGRRLARRIAADRPDRFLYLGDVYETGTAAEFANDYDPLYGSLARQTAPTPGNHDWGNHRTGYDPYWHGATGRTPRSHYAFRAGGWQIISLNSERAHGPGSTQLRWLRSKVGDPGTCRLAFWHRARYSAGVHGDQSDLAPVWDVLSGHAHLVLSGHDHDMQRFERRNGITQYVSGAGGRGRYPVSRDPRLAFGDDDHYGALRIELEPGRASLEFVSARGRVLDRSTARCRVD